jgi:L-ascorbate metabolism protein UlaG (beta-lactamase superfamily)
MKNPTSWLFVFIVAVMFGQCNPEDCNCPEPKCPETDITDCDILVPELPNPAASPLDNIKDVLLNNPPNTGDPMLREEAIMMFDAYLSIETSRDSISLFDFYTAMMDKVAEEIDEEVLDGIRIWMMYNHGFIIKTPHNTFAFDLIDGYQGWQSYRNYELPDNIVKAIDMLCISHEHIDHTDKSLIQKVSENGGLVINNSSNESIQVDGMHINIHFGEHSVVNRIFEVTTANGYKIVHTGDNGTSEALPDVEGTDVLLLNAWVNESGTTYSSVGMKNCINKLNPSLMIPGHIHELYHDAESRAKYKWSFYIDDGTLPCHLLVLGWGEKFDFVQ